MRQITDNLDRKFVLPAALLNLLYGALAIAGACAATWWMSESFTQALGVAPGAMQTLAVAAAVIGVLIAIGSLALLRRVSGAQMALLVGQIALAAAALAALMSAAMDKTFPVGLAASLVLSGICAAMLVLASARGSRLRYASVVALTVGAAVAVMVTINVVAQADPYRRSLESLGQYGLSDRTRMILADIKEPVRVSVVYGSARARKNPEFASRVLEQLEEMRRANPRLEYRDASSDAEKAALLARISSRLTPEAKAHDALLRAFKQESPGLLEALRGAARQWAAALRDRDSYLSQWDAASELAEALDETLQGLEEAQNRVQRGLGASGVPDYSSLTEPLSEALKEVSGELSERVALLSKIKDLPGAVAPNKNKALLALQEASAAAAAMQKSLTPAAQTAPADPQKALEAALGGMDALATAASEAAEALDQLAGPDNVDLLHKFGPMSVTGYQNVGGFRVPVRQPVASVYRQMARLVLSQKTAIAKEMETRKASALEEVAGDVAQLFAALREQLDYMQTKAQEGISAVDKLDDASAESLSLLADGKLLAGPLATLASLAEKAKDLPKIKDQKLSSDLSGEDIVIVEAGGQVRVAGFEDVWPAKLQDRMATLTTGEVSEMDRRSFNGDSAVASRILSMTHKPFARVMLAYAPPPPQLMQQMMMRGQNPNVNIPGMFSALRKRLEEANFEVRNWDVGRTLAAAAAGHDDAHADDLDEREPHEPPASEPASMPTDMPTVVIVLPTGLPMTPEQQDRLTGAADSGVPVMFLTGWQSRRQPDDGVEEYLRGNWGIDVKSDYRVLAGVANTETPGRYRIDVIRFSVLPLSTFTDHPMARPLQGRRMLWNNVAPVAAVRPPAGVKTQPLLNVEDYGSLWATRNVEEVIYRIRYDASGYFAPDWAGGDLKPPFPVAMAASREAQGQRPASKVVVLGMGQSYADGFMTEQMPALDSAGGFSFEPPPLANADLVVNGVYWMIDNPALISAGPAMVKPVQKISDPTLLRLLCVVVYPAAVVLAGGLVMFIRRR
jgi:hypothetical protein